jgi:hypothetical protein
MVPGARPSVVVRRVDVAQQTAIWIEGGQLRGSDGVHRKLQQRIADAQVACVDSGAQVDGESPCVGRTQRMKASRVEGYDGCSVATSFDEIGEEWRCQERHVTGEHQHLFRWRLHQRRIEAAKRSRIRDVIGDDSYSGGLHFKPVPADDQYVGRETVQQRQLPCEDRTSADDQRALVDAAEPPGLAAREDSCCPGNVPLEHD